MTDKEMHRLSRRELLQLLLAQVSETEDLKRLLAERDSQLAGLNENYEKLRQRLDQKDAKIHDLRDMLREERTTRRIELEEAGSIAEAALRLNRIFDMAQKAADQYLENVKRLHESALSGEAAGGGHDDVEETDRETEKGFLTKKDSDGNRPDENQAGILTEPQKSETEADDLAAGREDQAEADDLAARPEDQTEADDWAAGREDQAERDDWAARPEDQAETDDWAARPEDQAETDDWTAWPEDQAEKDDREEPSGADENFHEERKPETGEDVPEEHAEQDGQRALWQEKEKQKKKKRWKRPVWNK